MSIQNSSERLQSAVQTLIERYEADQHMLSELRTQQALWVKERQLLLEKQTKASERINALLAELKQIQQDNQWVS